MQDTVALTNRLKELQKANKDLKIPDFLNKEYVKEQMNGNIILNQFTDEEAGIYCVTSAYKMEEGDSIADMEYYYTRFFAMGNKTVHSHDATASNLLEFSMKLAGIAHKWFSR